MHLGFVCVQLSFAILPGKTPECLLISLGTQFLSVLLSLPGYNCEKHEQQLSKAVNVCPPQYLCPGVPSNDYVYTLLSWTCLTDVFQLNNLLLSFHVLLFLLLPYR